MTEKKPTPAMADHVDIYRELVFELTNDSLDEKKIKTLMEQLGLNYSLEKIDRLTQVLAYTPSAQNKGAVRDL